jgi:hypothetical protein
LSTSYYFGGPLAHLTARVQVWERPYSFAWSDPQTGERYDFGEGKRGPHLRTEHRRSGPARPRPWPR